MRVEIDDDLESSGRLSKLARYMGWNEREALGALVKVYRTTQRGGIIEASVSKLITQCSIHFDSDEQTLQFINAMLAAKLAQSEAFTNTRIPFKSGSSDAVFIVGNGKKISKRQKLRTNASLGGKSHCLKNRHECTKNRQKPLEVSSVDQNSSMISEPFAKQMLAISTDLEKNYDENLNSSTNTDIVHKSKTFISPELGSDTPVTISPKLMNHNNECSVCKNERLTLFCICIRSKKDLFTVPDLDLQHIVREDLSNPHASKKIHKSTKKRNVTENSPAYTRAVAAWFEFYRERYGIDPHWGPLQGRQMSHIMRKSSGPDELVLLIKQFFRGPYQDTIDAGHPLSDGFACLAKRIEMLRADILDPGRRVASSQIRSRLKKAEKAIGENDEFRQAMDLLESRTHPLTLEGNVSERKNS